MLPIKKEFHIWDFPMDLYVDLNDSFKQDLFDKSRLLAPVFIKKLGGNQLLKLCKEQRFYQGVRLVKGRINTLNARYNLKKRFGKEKWVVLVNKVQELRNYYERSHDFAAFYSDLTKWLDDNEYVSPYKTKPRLSDVLKMTFEGYKFFENFYLAFILVNIKRKYIVRGYAIEESRGIYDKVIRMLGNIINWQKRKVSIPLYIVWELSNYLGWHTRLESKGAVIAVAPKTGGEETVETSILNPTLPLRLSEKNSSNIAWTLGHMFGSALPTIRSVKKRLVISGHPYYVGEKEYALEKVVPRLEGFFGNIWYLGGNDYKKYFSITIFSRILAKWCGESERGGETEFIQKLGSEKREVPKVILGAKREEVREFLRAYFDDKCSVSFNNRPPPRNDIQVHFKFLTHTKKFGNQVKYLLLKYFKIKTGKLHTSPKLVKYACNISKDSVYAFAKELGFELPTKKEKLRELLTVLE